MSTRRLLATRLLIRGVVVAISLLVPLAQPLAAVAVPSAESIEAELRAGGVPVTRVELGPPQGIEAELYEDPTAPDPGLQVLRVTLLVPEGERLAGVLPPTDPFAIGLTTTTPRLLLWDLAIHEAAKHARLEGAGIAGISLTTNVAGRLPLTQPDVLFALPEPLPAAIPPATLSPEAVEERLKDDLPVWAQAGNLEVVDDPAGERIVTFTLNVPAAALALLNVESLSETLRIRQLAETLEGAKIGRVIVEVADPASGDPLYRSADDVMIGYGSSWLSPLVPEYIGHAGTGRQEADQAIADAREELFRQSEAESLLP